jgi:thiamine pyrophosphokinase
MKVAVIANGNWDPHWGRKELAKEKIDVLICADGGGNHAVSSGRIPDVIVGDLDSISEASLSKCQSNNTKIKKYPVEKDQTDLELALEHAEEYLRAYGKPEDEIILYAAGGKRLDHLLGNIALMLHWAEKDRTIKMLDNNYQAWVMLPGTKTIKGTQGQELSLIPLSAKAQVTSRGLYYELDKLTLSQNSTRGISNVFKEDLAKIQVHEGKILVIITV